MLLQLCSWLHVSCELQTKVVAALLKWDLGAEALGTPSRSSLWVSNPFVGVRLDTRFGQFLPPVYFRSVSSVIGVTLGIDQRCY